MPAPLADIVCDTSFLMHLATRRIRNIDRLGEEIGSVTFVVPEAVLGELESLRGVRGKKEDAEAALRYAKRLGTVSVGGDSVDDALAEYARESRCMVGTMDRELKRRVREAGGSVVSFWSDRMILEE